MFQVLRAGDDVRERERESGGCESEKEAMSLSLTSLLPSV